MIPTFPKVDFQSAKVVNEDSTTYWVFKILTKVRLKHDDGFYYKSIVIESSRYPVVEDGEFPRDVFREFLNRFMENCYSHLLLGKVNPNLKSNGFPDTMFLYEKDEETLSDKELLDMKRKVLKAQYEAWMNNIISGKGDANGEFVPSNKQITEQMEKNDDKV